MKSRFIQTLHLQVLLFYFENLYLSRGNDINVLHLVLSIGYVFTVFSFPLGIILIPGGAIGSLLGGLIVSKLRMSCKGQMKFVMVTSIISLLLFILIIFVECDTVQFAGISENYEG